MTNKEIIGAYTALLGLGKMPLKVQDAYNVYRLRKALQPAFEFCAEEERKVFEKHDGVMTTDGVHFPADTDMAAVRSELDALSNMESDVVFDPVIVSLDNMKGLQITPDDLEKLEGFVTFN